tara:strand:+ start:293 stop:520 length:228 start_codon:yes stop_codon:yes gene_type:complete
MNENASQLIKDIKLKYKSMYQKMHEIDDLKKEISDLKKVLYNKCTHEWVRDWDDRDARSSWICKHCDLYRNPNYN